MDFQFTRFEILTTTAAFYLCLAFVCVFTKAQSIEERLGAEVAAAVGAENLFWASVEPRGQRIVLSGAAPGFAEKDRAGAIAAGVFGVSAVDNRIAIIGEAGTCQRELDDYLNAESVTFRRGKAEITDASLPLLNLVASVVRNCNTRLEIAAHTDAEGDAVINQKLSQRRADAVRRYLVQTGVEPDRLEARGYGESQPLADNATDEGRRANRRVEFRVLGDAA